MALPIKKFAQHFKYHTTVLDSVTKPPTISSFQLRLGEVWMKVQALQDKHLCWCKQHLSQPVMQPLMHAWISMQNHLHILSRRTAPPQELSGMICRTRAAEQTQGIRSGQVQPPTASAVKGHLSNKQHFLFIYFFLFVIICNTRKAVLATATSYLQMTNGSSSKWVHRDAGREEGSYQENTNSAFQEIPPSGKGNWLR